MRNLFRCQRNYAKFVSLRGSKIVQFGEKLKLLRAKEKMTQQELAEKIGVTTRTLQNYEMGKMYPKQSEIYGKLSEIFNVTADYLLSTEDRYIITAQKLENGQNKKELLEIIADLTALFENDFISESEKDDLMREISEIYWNSKKKK